MSLRSVVDTGLIEEPPGGGQSYARSADGWSLTVGGEVTRHQGSGTGNLLIETFPYDLGDGPDLYDVEVVANEVGSPELCGVFTMTGAASRGATGSVAEFVSSRSDAIPRNQSLRMRFVGGDLQIFLKNAVAVDLEYVATIRRKAKADF